MISSGYYRAYHITPFMVPLGGLQPAGRPFLSAMATVNDVRAMMAGARKPRPSECGARLDAASFP